MFAPPKELKPEIWSVIPEELRAKEPSEWVRVKLHGQMLHSFLEGPAFDRNGNLYVVDIPYGRIFCISPDKKWRVRPSTAANRMGSRSARMLGAAVDKWCQ